jgi:hypothetical protein
MDDSLGGKSFADVEKVKTEVRKWLRQRSKYFYPGKEMGRVGGGYVEKEMFLPSCNITCFIFDIHL